MANTQNLIPLNKRTKSEQREIAQKGGKASGQSRARAKSAREIAQMLDALAVTGKIKEGLQSLGIAPDDQTQLTARMVALHKRALNGDVSAIKLWLEITGEAPATTVSVEVNDEARQAYERAAATIKGTKK